VPYPNIKSKLTYLLTYAMEQSPSKEANMFSASQEIPRILWNPEGSLPHSQVPATCPYHEPARSSPYPTSHWLRSILILSANLRLGLPSGLFPSGFLTRILYTPLPHTRFKPRPSHSSRFYHPNNIG